MTPPRTSIRLIDVADAPVIASHLARDDERFARWEPARPNGFHTTLHQVDRIEQLNEELGLHRAEAHTQMENLASHGVLRNNGFTPWGRDGAT
jgi:hypothetical protein